jgi:hypothetical protein
MAHVISFRTARFDVSKETRNPINPIAGEGVLNWLRPALERAHYRTTAPSTEDWGWYVDVEGGGASYLVGASADAEDPNPERDWTIQVHKHRSLKDKLLGRHKMTPDDPLSALIERIVREDDSILQIEVDREV